MIAPPLLRVLKVGITLIVLVVIWEISCRAFQVPSYLVPAPSAIAEKLYEKRDLYLGHTWVTLYETLAGFALAVVIGVVAAALIVVVPSVRDIVMPLLLIAQIVPKVAIAPILLIWFGYGLLPKVIIAFLVAFFPIVVNVASGLAAVERELLDLGHSLEATRWQIFWKFRMPTALPELFSGMKIAITLAVIGAVIGEFVGASEGLGWVIVNSGSNVNTSLAFGAMALLAAMSIALFYAIVAAERLLVPWAEHMRQR
jgi:NitT/TauT family transport system permease protein